MARRLLAFFGLLFSLSSPLLGQTGDLQVFVSTSGTNLDSDGYVVGLDDISQSVSVNGSVAFSRLSPGSYTALLIDVAEHCTVQGANPRTAVVAQNGVAELRFEVLCTAAAVPVAATPAPRSVPSRGLLVELGVDFGVLIAIPDNGSSGTAINIPASRFRVGIFASDVFSIEPALGIAFLDIADVQTTAIGFQTGFVYHSSPHRDRSRAFFQILGGLEYLNIEGFDAIQFSVGGGIGGKLPIADQLAARIEANYLRGFKNDDVGGTNTIEGLFGFSFFTR